MRNVGTHLSNKTSSPRKPPPHPQTKQHILLLTVSIPTFAGFHNVKMVFNADTIDDSKRSP